MSYFITNQDLAQVSSNQLDLSVKMEILSKEQEIVGVIQGNIVSASFHLDSGADIRRTCDLELYPDTASKLALKEDGLLWLSRAIRLSIGVCITPQGDSSENRSHQYMEPLSKGTFPYKKGYTWYSQGYYYLENAESSYDITTNLLKLSCSDFMILLNGTKNGSLGVLQTTIPAYAEKEPTGEVVEYYAIRDVMIQTLEQLAHIKQYIIDDMGEYMAMPDYNRTWEKYRKEHPLWNAIPYDLGFDAGCSVYSILTQLRDLYPNYEMFFDTEGTFICQMIPSCYQDDLTYSNEFLQKLLLSEDISLDMSSVRNICMVWGRVIQADYYTELCTYSDNIYSATVDSYEKYQLGDTVAIKVSAVNGSNCFLKLNQLDTLPVYDEVTGAFITKGTFQAEGVYVFKLKYITQNQDAHLAAFLLGQWQVQALNVLVDGTQSTIDYSLSTGGTVKKYSKEYFQDIYHCKTVSLTVIPDSPFTVQKIGEILDVKNGEEFNKISSDSMALARAEYENWKNCRLTDSITIKTKIVPFADVNVKCAYQRSDFETPQQYIITSVSHSLSEGTTTWTMYRFYPLYQDTLDAIGIHKTLTDYKHGLLGKYTHDQLLDFVSGGTY